MTKRDLINEPQNFESEDRLLEWFFSERLNKFCILFNGELSTFKTFKASEKKCFRLVEKFGLEKVEVK